jgi:hypothetical protein
MSEIARTNVKLMSLGLPDFLRQSVSLKNVWKGSWAQPVDATQALKRCAGVSKSNVFLGRSLS